jgi:hypothetical protein
VTASADRPGCPTCLGNPMNAFDWDYAVAGRLSDPSINVAAVQVVRPLKFGELLRCGACSQQWFLMRRGDGGSTQSWVKAVPRDREMMVQRWSDEAHWPDEAAYAVLRTIRASPSEGAGFGARTVVVPCRVLLSNGEVRDPAMIYFSRHPPVDTYFKHLAWIEEVAQVAPSRLALSQEVRIAASQAWEIRMSFRPLPVLAANGDEFTLDAPEDFFDVSGVEAHGVRVRPWGSHSDLRGPLVRMPLERITFVIADWTPEDETLKLPVP